MAELVGSIHQFLNNGKETIVSWCKDAAKTVCLPLTGGTVSGNITSTGEITSRKVTVNEVDTTSAFLITGDHPYVDFKLNNVTKGTWPSSTYSSCLYFYSNNNSSSNNRYGMLQSYVTSSKVGMSLICYTNNANSTHDNIGIIWDSTTGFYTYAPHPMNLDTSTNKFVINPADNSNKIATTGWVNTYMNQMANGTLGSTATGNARYIKFPNGKLICSGLLWKVYSGTRISFPVPFVGMEPHVVISRHWGGNNPNPEAGATWVAGSAPLQVYDTSTTVSNTNKTYTGFRVGVYTHNSTDMATYINKQEGIYGMWIAFGEWK